MAKSETVQTIIQSIREHREKFERFCRSLSEEELGQPVPGSSWVVKDFVSHLATLDAEMARSFEAAAAELEIVGWMPSAYLESMRERFPGISFRGSVDNVTGSLRGARLALIPEAIGGGFKHKSLQFVFNRLPMATLNGCLAGTPLADGETVFEYADIHSLTEGALQMLDDLPLLNRLQAAAFRACDGLRGLRAFVQSGNGLKKIIYVATGCLHVLDPAVQPAGRRVVVCEPREGRARFLLHGPGVGPGRRQRRV